MKTLRRLCLPVLLVCGLPGPLWAAMPQLKLSESTEKNLTKARSATNTPFDVKEWVDLVQKNKSEESAHLWAHVQSQLPKNLQSDAKVAYLVQLQHLGLSQVFVDSMLKFLNQKDFAKSVAWRDLRAALQPHMAQYLVDEAIVLSQDQKATIDKLTKDDFQQALKVWAQRDSATAKDIELAPANLPIRPYLLPKHVYQLAAAQKVEAAIDLLDEELSEPNLTPEVRAMYQLQKARVLFQAADLDAAEQTYLQIPETSASVNEAREELLWVWLRKSDHSRLRGSITAMPLKNYENKFFPELFVIRAISNLKLCRYNEAKEDFGNFITYNKEWADKIEAALKSSKIPEPPSIDLYTQQLATASTKRASELAKVTAMKTKSLGTRTPAVGVQKHWKDAEQSLTALTNRLEQDKQLAYRRIWSNQTVMLQEAIRKMKFVKVELLSQIEEGHKGKPDSDASKQNAEEVMSKVDQEGQGRFVFPFDGVTWPDEEFAARSTANNICL